MQCNCKLKIFQLASIIIFANCVQIKIIDGPFSIQQAGIQPVVSHAPVDVKIVSKVKPKAISGPPHLFPLSGKCFKLEKQIYKYEFCPFHNVTQRENSHHWNSFQGVLGVWKEWGIANHTFEHMLMTNGETCLGFLQREVQVYFKCGSKEKFENIEEPRTCKYNLTFQTPLACAEDAFMVYPVLSDNGREQLDVIDTAYTTQELTVQGYDKERRQLFIKEGFLVDDEFEKKEELKKSSTASGKAAPPEDENSYKSFSKDECIENYRKLLEEVQRLRMLLSSVNASQGEKERAGNLSKSASQVSASNAGQFASKIPIYRPKQSALRNPWDALDNVKENKLNDSKAIEQPGKIVSRTVVNLSIHDVNAMLEEHGGKKGKGSLDNVKWKKEISNDAELPLDNNGGIIHHAKPELKQGSLRKKRGKMGDDGTINKGIKILTKNTDRFLQATMQKFAKKRRGKMGDEGDLVEGPKHTNKIKKGHWLSRSIKSSKKLISLRNGKKPYHDLKETDDKHSNHLYH